ncbi:hypothetical protein HOC00_02885 [Candidatus Peregrinibacteria bacterium]|nr:hypothetical protein [Candidatus Peregrinibacteria bacterium]
MVNPEIYDESTLEVSRDLIESNTDMAKMDMLPDSAKIEAEGMDIEVLKPALNEVGDNLKPLVVQALNIDSGEHGIDHLREHPTALVIHAETPEQKLALRKFIGLGDSEAAAYIFQEFFKPAAEIHKEAQESLAQIAEGKEPEAYQILSPRLGKGIAIGGVLLGAAAFGLWKYFSKNEREVKAEEVKSGEEPRRFKWWHAALVALGIGAGAAYMFKDKFSLEGISKAIGIVGLIAGAQDSLDSLKDSVEGVVDQASGAMTEVQDTIGDAQEKYGEAQALFEADKEKFGLGGALTRLSRTMGKVQADPSQKKTAEILDLDLANIQLAQDVKWKKYSSSWSSTARRGWSKAAGFFKSISIAPDWVDDYMDDTVWGVQASLDGEKLYEFIKGNVEAGVIENPDKITIAEILKDLEGKGQLLKPSETPATDDTTTAKDAPDEGDPA